MKNSNKIYSLALIFVIGNLILLNAQQNCDEIVQRSCNNINYGLDASSQIFHLIWPFTGEQTLNWTYMNQCPLRVDDGAPNDAFAGDYYRHDLKFDISELSHDVYSPVEGTIIFAGKVNDTKVYGGYDQVVIQLNGRYSDYALRIAYLASINSSIPKGSRLNVPVGKGDIIGRSGLISNVDNSIGGITLVMYKNISYREYWDMTLLERLYSGGTVEQPERKIDIRNRHAQPFSLDAKNDWTDYAIKNGYYDCASGELSLEIVNNQHLEENASFDVTITNDNSGTFVFSDQFFPCTSPHYLWTGNLSGNNILGNTSGLRIRITNGVDESDPEGNNEFVLPDLHQNDCFYAEIKEDVHIPCPPRNVIDFTIGFPNIYNKENAPDVELFISENNSGYIKLETYDYETSISIDGAYNTVVQRFTIQTINLYGNDILTVGNTYQFLVRIPSMDQSVETSGIVFEDCNAEAFFPETNFSVCLADPQDVFLNVVYEPNDISTETALVSTKKGTAQDYVYQWYKNGQSLTRTMQPSIKIPNENANYKVEIINSDIPGSLLAMTEDLIEIHVKDCDKDDENGGFPPHFPPCIGCSGWQIPIFWPFDPNEILGPGGYGAPRWVAAKDKLYYTVLFENDPDMATSAVQRVKVTVPVDPGLDMKTFRIGQFGFARQIFDVPDDVSYYTGYLKVADSLKVDVEALAGIDMDKREAYWIFQAVDPQTGQAPLFEGFLPVNDSTASGEGFVSFSIKPNSPAVTGDTVRATASVLFDINEAIETNTWFNTLDADIPISKVGAVPEVISQDSLKITITYQDTGSGVQDVALYASEDEKPYKLLAYLDKENTGYFFKGTKESQYRFFSRAIDATGNAEPFKDSAETSVAFVGTELSMGYTLHHATCFNSTDAGIDLEVSGGIPPYAYLWSNDSIGQDISNIAAGSYGITISDKTGIRLVDTFIVNQPDPVFIDLGNDILLLKGEQTVLKATPGYRSYLWNDGSTNDSLVVGPGLDTLGYSYSVTVTDSNGCTNADTIQVFVYGLSDILELSPDARIKLFPNPTKDILCIQIRNDSNREIEVMLSDMTGKQVYHELFSGIPGESLKVVDLTGFDKGNYLITIQDGNHLLTSNIVLY